MTDDYEEFESREAARDWFIEELRLLYREAGARGYPPDDLARVTVNFAIGVLSGRLEAMEDILDDIEEMTRGDDG